MMGRQLVGHTDPLSADNGPVARSFPAAAVVCNYPAHGSKCGDPTQFEIASNPIVIGMAAASVAPPFFNSVFGVCVSVSFQL